jgi:rod shape determining protein RodA
MVAILEKRRLRDFDWLLTLLALAIAIFGTWQIFNAQPEQVYWKKQLIGLGISTVVMLAVGFTDYRKLVHIAPAFYVFGLLLLVIVLIPGIGMKINGQRCWISLRGLGQFQPSEFMKIPTVLMLARYFGRPRSSTLTLKETLMGGAILALPVGLIMLEPDAGQAITYFPLLAVVLFLSSIRMWLVVASLLLGTVAVPAAYVVGVKTGAIKSYQQERINVILDPENADRRGFGYHTWQSIVTVGKGRINGSVTKGNASQSGLGFLPEPHTDFIFAAWAEEHGFVGAVALLLLYFMVLMRLIHNAQTAPDRAGGFVVMGVVAILLFHILVNAGMVVGFMPVTGIPLPLMSYGGSSLLFMFLALGIVNNIRMRRFVN